MTASRSSRSRRMVPGASLREIGERSSGPGTRSRISATSCRTSPSVTSRCSANSGALRPGSHPYTASSHSTPPPAQAQPRQPSRHRFFSVYATASAASRDSATASHAAQRHSFSSFSRSRAATHAPVCSENTSSSAHNLKARKHEPREVTLGQPVAWQRRQQEALATTLLLAERTHDVPTTGRPSTGHGLAVPCRAPHPRRGRANAGAAARRPAGAPRERSAQSSRNTRLLELGVAAQAATGGNLR